MTPGKSSKRLRLAINGAEHGGVAEVEERRWRFLQAARGLSAWRAGQVMSKAGTPGIDWRGSPKGRMANAYAAGQAYGTTVDEAVIGALNLAPRAKP